MFKFALFSEKHQLSPKEREELHGRESLPLKISIRCFFRIMLPFWTSRASLWAWVLLAVIIALTSGAIWLATRFNTWYKEFWDTIQNYDLPGFKQQLMMFVILAAIHVVVSVYRVYFRSKLSIMWRRWLTGKVMNDWLTNDTYYKIQLRDRKTENPDQRIQEDLASFVSSSISLLLGTATDIATLITFSVVLWGLSQSVDMELWNGYVLHLPDGYMFYLALIYAIIGTTLTFIIGKPLVRLNFRQQRYEADFRFSLIRVRENSESISLYHGEEQEEENLRGHFKNVVGNFIKLIKYEKRLGFFTLSYAQTAVIFPILIAAPMYFAKIITMGSIIQINSAFGQVQDALSTLISNFSSWASFKAQIDRLSLYFDSMNESEDVKCIEPKEEGEDFAASGLTVKSPAGEVLCADLGLKLGQGDSILIRGQSGCGKSTLIRSLAGIWPYADGEVTMPASGTRLFLSQKPYLPQGTLRQAAGYPGPAEKDGRTEKYFEKLGLSHLIPRLDEVNLWDHMLSLGEQQRVAFVRALLLKPAVLILDEATSALDEKREMEVYDILRKELPDTILLSVGHRSTLLPHHRYVLNCGTSQHWKQGKNLSYEPPRA